MPADPTPSIQLAELLAKARRELREAGIDDPGLDSRLIVQSAAGLDHAAIIAEPKQRIAAATAARIDAMIARRAAREPLHRILGWREFYGLRLELGAAVLEPRPDTETLVELVLPIVRECVRCHGHCDILDLGTGSGAIALALLSQVLQTVVTAVDISPEALKTAETNARRFELSDRFRAIRSDWYSSLSGRFHIIVSNPPYIRRDELDDLAPEVREHDPRLALCGGADGLDAYRQIAAGADRFLEVAGHVAVEIGQGQKRAVTGIFEASGFALQTSHRDLSGLDRALLFAR